jgi:hypothetical protein
MTLAYKIDVVGSPIFDYRTHADNTCGKGFPGTVRLFIQRKGDDLSGNGEKQQYRYWSTVGFKELAPGLFSIQSPVDPSKWSDVFGKLGSDYPDRFAAAFANAERAGMTFGGGCFYGHGVMVTGGSAQFHVISFRVQ